MLENEEKNTCENEMKIYVEKTKQQWQNINSLHYDGWSVNDHWNRLSSVAKILWSYEPSFPRPKKNLFLGGHRRRQILFSLCCIVNFP